MYTLLHTDPLLPVAVQVLFNFKCSWEGLDHQHGDCGQFEFFRNNEWLTKQVSGYPSEYIDQIGVTCINRNTLCIRNSVRGSAVDLPTDQLSEIERYVVSVGGQMVLNMGLSPVMFPCFFHALSVLCVS